eukprot:4628641-Amphidinium_carterae.1
MQTVVRDVFPHASAAGRGQPPAASSISRNCDLLSSSCKSPLAFTTHVIVAVASLARRQGFANHKRLKRQAKTAPEWQPSNPGREVDLLPEEAGPILHWPSITTMTLYKGKPPVAKLKERLLATLRANLWLVGRLQRSSSKSAVVLWVPSRIAKLSSSCFTEVNENELDEDVKQAVAMDGQSMEAMEHAVKSWTIPKGLDCVNQDQPLFRVTLFHVNSN